MRFLYIVLLILILTICACGGGTTGTGEIRTRTFTGTVQNTQNQPVAAVNLVILESGDSTQTDSSGNFTLTTDVPEGNLNLLVELTGFEQTIKLSNLDPAVANYTLLLQVDIEGESIELTSIKVTTVVDDTIDDEDNQDNPPVTDDETEEVIKSIFKGVVIFEDNSPAKGVKVRLNGSSSITTNAQGIFKIEQEYRQKNATLSFSYTSNKEKLSGVVRLSKLPATAFVVELKIKLNRTDGVQTNEILPDLELLSSKVKERR